MHKAIFVFAVLASLALVGCKGASSPTAPSAQNLTARITVVGEGHPLPNVTIAYAECKSVGDCQYKDLGVTGPDGSLTVTVPKGSLANAYGFGFGKKDFNITSEQQQVSLDPADDVELTELYADSTGVIRDGGTIYYPTTLRIRGRYRSVTVKPPEMPGIGFDFLDFIGGGTAGSGGPVSYDRVELVYYNWDPCKYDNNGVCVIRYSKSDYIRWTMGSTRSQTPSLVKVVPFKLTFVQK